MNKKIQNADKKYFKLEKIISRKGGVILSKRTERITDKIHIKCLKCGHHWWAEPYNIFSGTWCKPCYSKRRSSTQLHKTIADMNKLAKLRGGSKAKCLSTKYQGAHVNLSWFCPIHGEFEMKPNNVRIKSWCQKCSYEKRANKYPHRLDLAEAKAIAKDRGGCCTSTKYKNSSTKLDWKCKYNHEWSASLSTVKKGFWCSECSGGQGENITRLILQYLFLEKFPKSRPSWLLNPKSGYPLELDGYCEKLQLAFEYQGEQHLKFSKFYHKSMQDFQKLKISDNYKYQKANSRGVKILLINQVNCLGEVEQFKSQLKEQLIINKVNFNKKRLMDIKLSQLEIFSPNNDIAMEILQIKVREFNGKILSKQYIGGSHKMKFLCNKGHPSFSSKPNNVLGGSWCKLCGLEKIGDLKRLSFDEVRKTSRDKGFKFLSNDYQNARTIYKFECQKCGHVKNCTFGNISTGSGCPKCKKNLKYTIEDCQKAAEKLGGKCLSSVYKGARTPLKWECEFGDKWPAAPSGIINRRSWCPDCAIRRRSKK
ncbi:MAG: hypothetical protein ACOYL6_02560 [Bacteriovoracaceae bacterium]